MKRETLRHPKTFDLAARLGVSRPEALGFLTLLWDFTAESAPQGNVGKWPNGAIARACDWPGDPDHFIEALVEAGWLDAHPAHRLVVHDLADHAERWWCLKLEKLGLDFVSSEVFTEASTERSIEASTESPTETPTEASPSRDLTKPNLTKPNLTKPNLTPGLPDSLLEVQDLWEDYVRHRKQAKSGLTPVAARRAIRRLEEMGVKRARDALEHSLANGYRGIFEPSGNSQASGKGRSVIDDWQEDDT